MCDYVDMDTRKKDIGSRLKELRKDRNLTQKEFAKVLKITDKKYQNIERGITGFPEFLCRFVSIKFQVSVKWLLHGEGDMYIRNTQAAADEKKKAKGKFVDLGRCRMELGAEIERLEKILSEMESCRKMDFDNTTLMFALKEAIFDLRSFLYPEKYNALRFSNAFLLPLLKAEEMASLYLLLDKAKDVAGGSRLADKFHDETILIHTYGED